MDKSPENQTHQGLTLYFLGKLHSGLKKLSAYYRQRGVRVFNVTSPDELPRVLDQGRPHALIIDLQSRADINRFIEALGKHEGLLDLPRIAVISSTTDQDTAEALTAQADESVVWPLKATDLSLKLFNLMASRGQFVKFQRDVRDEEGRFYRGELYPYFLRDVLQLIYLGRKDSILSLENEGRRGNLYFKEGKLIDAQVGALEWEDSLNLLRRFKQGTFVLSFQPVDRKRFIEKNVSAWLMQGDEEGELPEVPDPGEETTIGPVGLQEQAESAALAAGLATAAALSALPAGADAATRRPRAGEGRGAPAPLNDPMMPPPPKSSPKKEGTGPVAVGASPAARPAGTGPAPTAARPPSPGTGSSPPPSSTGPSPTRGPVPGEGRPRQSKETSVLIGLLVVALFVIMLLFYVRSRKPEEQLTLNQPLPTDTPVPIPSTQAPSQALPTSAPPPAPTPAPTPVPPRATPVPRVERQPVPAATPRATVPEKPQPTPRPEPAKPVVVASVPKNVPAPTPVPPIPTPVPPKATPVPTAVAMKPPVKDPEVPSALPNLERSDKNLKKARELEKSGKMQEALTVYTRIAELDPSSREASEAIARLKGAAVLSPMSPGELHINSYPYGIVYVDGEKQGYTPVHLPNVVPRKYLIRIVNPDVGACSTEVVLKPGELKRIHLRLDEDQNCQRSR